MAVCPVDTALPLWLSGPTSVVTNLIHSLSLSAYQFDSDTRTVNLPGLTITVQAMIEALIEVAGPDAQKYIQYQPEAAISRICGELAESL